MSRPNPYSSVEALVMWHDLYQADCEASRADWRELSAWVNANIPQYRRGEARGRPWLAIVEAYKDALERANG